MTLDVPGGSRPLAVVRVLRNGRRCYDPADKAHLIEACLAPGVSVARLALDHGVNANLLRNWIVLHRRRREAASALTALPSSTPPAFVPVVEAAPIVRRPVTSALAASAGMRLKASLPNGVRLELEGADARALSAMIQALGRCDVPAG
ncbi:IS66-like element accessory protein TnpA [Shinella sp.]|uniref:IS66-like element accessory protein TnpA n=1 Tax=Shinella sp. TaxID=1870904 RepID=UPI0039E665E2